jgi:hypothetical protein
MSHLNIKTPKNNDWFARGSALKQGQDLDKFGKDLNVSVVVHSNPGDSQVLMASRDRHSGLPSLSIERVTL